MGLFEILIAGLIYFSAFGGQDTVDITTGNQGQSASPVVTESAPQEKLSTPEVERAPATPPEITANIETQKEEQVVASTVEPAAEEKPVEQEQPATPAVEEKEPPTETSNTEENQPEVAAQSSTPIEAETTSTNWVKIIIYIAVGIFVIAGGLYFFVNRQKQHVQSAADQAKAKYEERQRERDQEEMGTSEPEQTNSPESSEDSNNSDDPNKQGP